MTTRSAARLTTALLLGLAALGIAAPAHAATPLSAYIDSQSCTDDGLMPGKTNVDQFDCTAAAGGGTGSYTYTFTGVANATFLGYISPDDGWGMCSEQPLHATVQVTVTDSSGATASAQTTFVCSDR